MEVHLSSDELRVIARGLNALQAECRGVPAARDHKPRATSFFAIHLLHQRMAAAALQALAQEGREALEEYDRAHGHGGDAA